MPDYTHSAADVYSLFSDGFLQSLNFGSLRPGEYRDNVDTGKNCILDRGSILFDRMGDATSDITITFGGHKHIHLYVKSELNELGFMSAITYNYGLYQDGAPYEFDGHEFGDAANPWVAPAYTWDGQQNWAWTWSPYSISFYSEFITNLDGTHAVAVGIMIVPEAYEDGEWYPFDVPITQIEERRIKPIMLQLMMDDPGHMSWLTEAIYQFFMDIVTFEIEYDDGDDQTAPSGGGGGTYESRNDWMDWPSLPTLSATSTGFVSLYSPTSSQLAQIANWLWSTDFADNIFKNYADPFNNILGLFISPVPPPTTASEFKVGNVASGITANKVGNQYMQISCGSVRINPYYNSFADYDNYRSYKLFLPYYGIVDLSTDDFMGGTVAVRYNIDFFTGSAAIAVGTTRSNGIQHILHTYSTNIFSQIPFSGVNMTSFYTQTLSSAASIIGSGIGGNIMGMTSGISGLLNAHPTYGGSRGMGSTAGLMGIQYPYLIECRSIRDMPGQYNKNEGIPLNSVKQVSTLSGYTEFDNIRISISKATDEERNEIKRIMMEGVIL